jgi:hypothetical protein
MWEAEYNYILPSEKAKTELLENIRKCSFYYSAYSESHDSDCSGAAGS